MHCLFHSAFRLLGRPPIVLLEEISIVRGNVILVDHGRRVADELLGTVEAQQTATVCEDAGQPTDSETVPRRFNPSLKEAQLTFSQPLPTAVATPAAALLVQDPRHALPQIVKLTGTREISGRLVEELWTPKSDLLGSTGLEPDFVVEMD